MATLDDLDARLLQALLDGAGTIRAAARRASTTPATAVNRLRRLEAHGLYRGSTANVAIERIGTLVLLDAPRDAADQLKTVPELVHLWETDDDRLVGLALVEPGGVKALEAQVPQASVTALTREVIHRSPRIMPGNAVGTCSACGKRSRDNTELVVGGRRYLACCPSCRQVLLRRAGRGDTGGPSPDAAGPA